MRCSLEEVDLRNGNAARNGHRSLYATDAPSASSAGPHRQGFHIAANGSREPQPLATDYGLRSDAPEWTAATHPPPGVGSGKLDRSRCACSAHFLLSMCLSVSLRLL